MRSTACLRAGVVVGLFWFVLGARADNYNAADWDGFKTALAAVSSVTDTITLTGSAYIYTADDDYAINASFTVVLGSGVGSASFKSETNAKFTITGGTQIWNDVTFELSDGSACAVTGVTAACDITFNDCTFQDSSGHGLSVSAAGAHDVTVTANSCTAQNAVANGFVAAALSSGAVLLTCNDCLAYSNNADGYNCTTTAGQTGTCVMVLAGCTATDNGDGAGDQSVTGHLDADITATDCTFSGATSSEFYMGAASSGTYIFTNCTFTGKADASSPCFGATGTAVVTLTGCTITNGNAAKNTFYTDGGTYTLTDCTLAGPAYYTLYTLGTSAVTVTATRCRIANTAASAAAADNALVWAANGGTIHLRECVLEHYAETADRPILETYTTTAAAVINVFGGVIRDHSFQSVSLVRGASAINIVGARVILYATATNRLASSAVFRVSTTGTQRLRGNYIMALGASGVNSGNYYIVDATAEAGSVAPVTECVGNVFDFPRFFASGDNWYAALIGTYTAGVFAGNEVYGDGTVLCGTKSSAATMVVAGNLFHNCYVGVTVSNDNQYGTLAGAGANGFVACGTTVSGGTPVLANGDQVLSAAPIMGSLRRSWAPPPRRVQQLSP